MMTDTVETSQYGLIVSGTVSSYGIFNDDACVSKYTVECQGGK
jgi:hypothetical protein